MITSSCVVVFVVNYSDYVSQNHCTFQTPPTSSQRLYPHLKVPSQFVSFSAPQIHYLIHRILMIIKYFCCRPCFLKTFGAFPKRSVSHIQGRTSFPILSKTFGIKVNDCLQLEAGAVIPVCFFLTFPIFSTHVFKRSIHFFFSLENM